ncbi:MAG: site-specific DNA-methyltransferase [Balneolaceae bacterium]
MSESIPALTELEGESLDLVAENIEKLKQLFPEIVTDGKVDFETLKEVLGDFKEESTERYSFTWNGKSQARKLAMTPSRGTLRPAPEESVNWDSTEHLFIEGDNLEVLKLLQRSYHKKVKMIYIDPPYNTGGDFIYKDNYKDNVKNYLKYTDQLDEEGKKKSSNPEKSGRYHTDWLNMIFPRIKLSWELLRDDGVIFVSIDDHEIGNLKKIMDEVYGEENFISNMIWQSRTSISNDQEVSLNHNHTLIYAKKIDEVIFYGDIIDKSDYSNPDNDPRGPWKLVPIDANKPGGDTYYPITNPDTGEEFYPPNGRSWAMNPKDYKALYDDNRIKFGKGGESAPKKKLFYEERMIKGDSKTPSSVITNEATTKDGTEELMRLFDGKKVFDYPKPVNLMKRFLTYGCERNSDNIVLDFFAGSGSLGHGIYACEEIDAKWILIQIPEPVDESKTTGKNAIKLGMHNLAETSKERLRRATIEMEDKSDKKSSKLGFKVFKLDTSNIKTWDQNFDDVQLSLEDSIENIKPDRSEADVLYEILLKYGLDLTLPIEEKAIDDAKVYVGGAGALILCLSDDVNLDVVEGIAAIKKEFNPELMRVVFRDSGFKDDVVKTNAVQILKQHGIEDVRSI